MRIQLASDLHLEMLSTRFPDQNIIAAVNGADLLVLAGDIENGLHGVGHFAHWPVPVLYVLGNHESYDRVFDDVRADIQRAAEGTSVVVLDNEVADLGRFEHWSATRQTELDHIRFLGCTLWTDYELPSAGADRTAAMEVATKRLMDHRLIRKSGGRMFAPQDALDEHVASRRWLERELASPFDGKTVVITHHAPHELSIHPRYQGDVLNAAFASHMPDLIAHADLWLHGHTHDSFDYTVNGCRVVANPMGYAQNPHAAREVTDLVFQNPSFKPACTVDI